jgi:L-threonylcarbamoyladenylate synthase
MENPIAQAIEVLNNGGLILYPSDTVWGLGCDPNNKEAVEKLNKLKQRKGKNFIVLFHQYKTLSYYVPKYAEVVDELLDFEDQPTTIVLPNSRNVCEGVSSEDGSLALRRIESPKNVVNLINRWKRGIISTSANISNRPTPLRFKDISKEITEGVDWIAPLNWEEKANKPSSIIRVDLNGEIKIIRK